MTRLFFLILISIFAIAPSMAQDKSAQRKVSDVTEKEDPNLWLEDVTGEKQLG